jgi:hypothetical protein
LGVDVHTHFIPEELVGLMEADPDRFQARVSRGETVSIVHAQGYQYTIDERFYDIEKASRNVLAWMCHKAACCGIEIKHGDCFGGAGPE